MHCSNRVRDSGHVETHLLIAVNELQNQTSHDSMDSFGALFLKEVISSIGNTCRIVALLVLLRAGGLRQYVPLESAVCPAEF